jgi:hypothetical protein
MFVKDYIKNNDSIHDVHRQIYFMKHSNQKIFDKKINFNRFLIIINKISNRNMNKCVFSLLVQFERKIGLKLFL